MIIKKHYLLGLAVLIALYVEAKPFQLVQNAKSVPIVFDQQDAEVVRISAKALADDIALITGVLPDVVSSQKNMPCIVIGTLGQSKFIDDLVAQKMMDGALLKGKWETYLLQTIDHPKSGKMLIIAGSDPRGTAFGIFELSKRLGVSPWVYWADVLPTQTKELSVDLDQIVMGPPSVKFRGIFLNDEDWGLKPWAAKKMDTDLQDIGPKTYARIFELMLRLKANHIWPAMHPCTKAFFYYPENVKVAERYGIVLGSSHCEPMLRNNVDEWKNNFEEEYGKKPGPWRYDLNQAEIARYWQDRVAASSDVDAVYTVGMRGIHDGSMPGPNTTEGKVKLLNEVIKDQRAMLSSQLGKNADEVPQIFCPYKEVLTLYQAGAEIPDDVTIVWADDNHGYIRKLSNPGEQQRSGRSGVYYHLSYWGAPADYLWLCSTAPSLISYEMSKAYAYGADRLWMFNVGDIKPAELETEFALDLAWDVNAWPPEKAETYIEAWAARTFGADVAKEISEIKKRYYQLAASGKPEHMDRIQAQLSTEDALARIAAYQDLANKADTLKDRIPAALQDAYFQLMLYPVSGAARMNEKQLYAKLGQMEKAQKAFDEIKALTKTYNQKIAAGKWDGIMSMHPRWQSVFKPPTISPDAPHAERPKPLASIPVAEMSRSEGLCLIPGLGTEGASLSWNVFDAPGIETQNAGNAPSASIQLKLPKGRRTVQLICVPTHAVYEGRALRTALRLDDGEFKVVDIDTYSHSEAWKKNVIQGYAAAEAVFELQEDGHVNLQLALLDPGLAVSKILVY